MKKKKKNHCRRHDRALRGQPGKQREAVVGRASCTTVVAGRRAAVVGQRRVFVVVVAATASDAAPAPATATIVVEVEVGVLLAVDAAGAGPAVVDEQRDGGRRQFVRADPAVVPAADGPAAASALFRRVRFALLGHGPSDQYPGRSSGVAQYAPDERAPVGHRAPAAPVRSAVVGGRRVAPSDGRTDAAASTNGTAVVEVHVRVIVAKVQSVGRTRGGAPSDRRGRFARLGQAHQGRPAAAEQQQRRGRGRLARRRRRSRLAVNTAGGGGRGHRRERRPARPARRRRPGLDFLVHLALGHHLPPVVLVRLLQQLVLDAVQQTVAQRRTGDQGERQRLDGRVGARRRAHRRAQRLVQAHAIVRQVERGQRADDLEHGRERVAPAQLVGHRRGQEERVPLVRDGHLRRQRHFEYRRRYAVPVVPGDSEHLRTSILSNNNNKIRDFLGF